MLRSLCNPSSARAWTKAVISPGRRWSNRFARSASTSSLPTVVKATGAEQEAGYLTSRNLERAVRAVRLDGLVVVENAIDHASLDHLNHKMVRDARTLQSMGDKGPFNYNTGNLQQDPPPVNDFFMPSVFLNPMAKQITSTVLGPRPLWTFCSGNTAVSPQSGSGHQRQPVHSDADFAHPDHPFALVVNVPMIDFYPENGSTEIWLGTHVPELTGEEVQEGKHGERASGRIKAEALEKRRAVRPPAQPNISKGSIVIRDLRLWHAGMPNFTDDVRVMLALIHFAPWYRNQMKLELSESVRDVIEGEKDLQIPVNWVSEERALDTYLNRAFGNSYDFDQTA